MAYTLIEDIANIYKTPILISAITVPSSKGITAQLIIANASETIGAIINNPKFDCVGNIVSLLNNLTPSAIGCNIPHTPTLVGPFLICIDANTFLSANVKYATPINTANITPNPSIIIFIEDQET